MSGQGAGSHELSRGTSRSRSIRGGKQTCSRCSEPRHPGSAYCTTHKNEYQRGWSRQRTEELRQYRQMVENEKRTATTP